MSKLKSYFIKANKIKNDIEDAIADFLNLFQNKKVDNAEITLIKLALSKGLQSATSGSISLTDEQMTTIASGIVKGLNKLNDYTQKQLRK